MAMTGLPLPELATKDVEIPATPFSTRNPLLCRYWISSRLDLNSRRASSGLLHMFRLTFRVVAAFCSIQRNATSFSGSLGNGADNSKTRIAAMPALMHPPLPLRVRCRTPRSFVPSCHLVMSQVGQPVGPTVGRSRGQSQHQAGESRFLR